LVTGPEYLIAKRQGCEFNIKSIFNFPPTESDWAEKGEDNLKDKTKPLEETEVYIKPFHEIIKDIQSQRDQTPKGVLRISCTKKWEIQSMEMLLEECPIRRVLILGLVRF
jgi:hypothetical protein